MADSAPVKAGDSLEGVCFHENKEKHKFIVEEVTPSINDKTVIAKGKCESCGYKLSRLVSLSKTKK